MVWSICDKGDRCKDCYVVYMILAPGIQTVMKLNDNGPWYRDCYGEYFIMAPGINIVMQYT